MSGCDREVSILRRTWPTGGCWAMEEEKDNINTDGLRNREKACGVVLFGCKQEPLIGCFIHANKPVPLQLERFRTS